MLDQKNETQPTSRSKRPGEVLVLGAAVGLAATAGVLLLRRRAAESAGVRARTAADGESSPAPRRRVVILGAGFGGMAVAETLTKCGAEGLDVIMVDRRNYHLFTPFLYQISAGLADPMHIVYPARELAARRCYRFRESDVRAIDLTRRVVATDDGDLSYDDLVIALGSTTNYFGLTEVQEHSLPLKGIGDAIAVRNRIIDAFEAADAESDPARRRELLTFAIVGAGATGVELAGGVQGLIHLVLLRHYPNLRAGEISIILLEAASQILPGWDPYLVEASRRALEQKGIPIRLNSPVVRVTPEFVELKDGERIPSRTVVWTAGVRPSSVVADLPVPKTRGGRLQVNDYLELAEYPGVFAIGDAAGFPDPKTGHPVPALAAVAEQQGKQVGENISRRAQGLPMRPYHYHLLGQSLSLGRNNAALAVDGFRMQGFLAWLGWRAAHLIALRGWRNRLGVLFDWAFSYLFVRETLRLEVTSQPCEKVTR